MQKVLSIPQIREADALTIQLEPVSSVDLMERAATQCYNWIQDRLKPDVRIKIFCGTGNNGGDGLVIARLLAEASFPVSVYIVHCMSSTSPDFLTNLQRLKEQDIAEIINIETEKEIQDIDPEDILIDALFGSGLTRALDGLAATQVEIMNKSGAVIISIDIPSGLSGDAPVSGPVIHADYTLGFEVPKLAFFFPENEQYLGEWHILPIGLLPQYLLDVGCQDYLLETDDLCRLMKPRRKFDHKGSYGHGLLIAGSYGKMGASILASEAALRSGAGLITTHIPSLGNAIIQSSVPESMVSIDPSPTHFSMLPDLKPYNAIACGPGIGTQDVTAASLKLLIQNAGMPLILDADALNILSENPTWLSFLPENTILTPHLKEFERLAGKSADWKERHEKQRAFSLKYGVYIVLKGAFSCISFPDGSCYFNPNGNPGMATGGSGDVLTGILLGLRTRGYSNATSCLLGTYLHGLAGDMAAQKKGMESLIAGDIIENLADSFLFLQDFYNDNTTIPQ